MRRFALFVVLQWFGMMAFSQSMAIAPGTSPSSSDKPSAPQTTFNFSGQFEQISPSPESRNTDFCRGLNANQSQASAQVDVNQLFHVPCVNLNTHLMMTRNNLPASPSLTGPSPNARLEPIPTQWPNAKVEQIPTTWPNLKMQQIAGQNPGSVPAK